MTLCSLLTTLLFQDLSQLYLFKHNKKKFTLFRMETIAFPKPRAKNWPSAVQEQLLILAPTLCFCTAFCSVDQNAKSDRLQETNRCVSGLKPRHCTYGKQEKFIIKNMQNLFACYNQTAISGNKSKQHCGR